MVSMSALPAGVLAEPAMREVALPVLRADYTLFEGYRCGDGTTVEVPPLTVAGARDTLAPPESMVKWAQRTTRGFSTRVLEGGHLLAAELPAVLAAEVTPFAARLVPGVLRAS
jgi:surfactin synthase thioesterase subunit